MIVDIVSLLVYPISRLPLFCNVLYFQPFVTFVTNFFKAYLVL